MLRINELFCSYTEENLPTHPCLRLDANCEQILSTRISRRLITMVKYREYLVSILDIMEKNISRAMQYKTRNVCITKYTRLYKLSNVIMVMTPK